MLFNAHHRITETVPSEYGKQPLDAKDGCLPALIPGDLDSVRHGRKKRRGTLVHKQLVVISGYHKVLVNALTRIRQWV